jgi:hypothetical protein
MTATVDPSIVQVIMNTDDVDKKSVQNETLSFSNLGMPNTTTTSTINNTNTSNLNHYDPNQTYIDPHAQVRGPLSYNSMQPVMMMNSVSIVNGNYASNSLASRGTMPPHVLGHASLVKV